jgi:hypothetical protein
MRLKELRLFFVSQKKLPETPATAGRYHQQGHSRNANNNSNSRDANNRRTATPFIDDI